MTYTVTITSTDGSINTYPCAGSTDETALIYAGKVVEQQADRADPDARVTIAGDGKTIGPTSTVREMTTKTV